MTVAAQKCMKEILLTLKLRYIPEGILKEDVELKLVYAVFFISYSYGSS
jgi:hypothetical protein